MRCSSLSTGGRLTRWEGTEFSKRSLHVTSRQRTAIDSLIHAAAFRGANAGAELGFARFACKLKKEQRAERFGGREMRDVGETSSGSALEPLLVTHDFGGAVCRLGLASYGRTAITADDVLSAVERGVNFLNWQGLAEGPSDGDAFTAAVSPLGAGRGSVVVCAKFGPHRARLTPRRSCGRR